MEDKGYMVLTIGLSGRDRGVLLEVSFVSLPARPMVSLVVEPTDVDISVLRAHLASELRQLDPDSVVRLILRGPQAEGARQVLSAALLRELAPPTMNIALAPERPERG